jgi:hypothetical protein
MFEELEKEQKEEKEERTKVIWMTAIVVGILAVVLVVVYIASRARPKAPQPVKSTAKAGQPAPAPDPVHDLQLVRAVMGKDPTGIRVMWSVRLRNKSAVYTYSDIQYEAYFLTRDGVRLGVNKDTIKDSIGPGEDKKFPDFVGGIYDAGASTYQFLVTGATAAAQ